MESVAAKRVHAGGSTVDRLSALPDELLLRILSFLPCQRAVQTTVLSKRWTGLWRSAPCINIDMTDISTCRNNDLCWRTWVKMEDLVTNLLMFHSAPLLDEFRFAVDYVSAGRLGVVNRWIRRAIACRPALLQIEILDLGRPGPFEFPHAGLSSFCRLRSLSLVRLSLGSSFAEQLLSGYPVLEDLHLEDCVTEFAEIHSHTLKKVSLLMCYRHSADTLAIRAPALVTLDLDLDFMIPDRHDEKNDVSIDGSSANSLVNAWLAFAFPPRDMSSSARSRVMLFGSLSNVTTLELRACFSAELMLDNELGKFPIFNNLRTLTLFGCVFGERDVIGKCRTLDAFLHKAPNLEKLTLEHLWRCCQKTLQDTKRKKRKMKAGSGRSLHSPDQKPFQCPNLKLIEINYEGCHVDDHHEQQLFQVMWGLWRNLPEATFTVNKI